MDNLINQILVPVLPLGPRLLALDVTKFHSNEEVLSTLHSHDIVPSLIPIGYTVLVKPLDLSVNKPFKCLFRNMPDKLWDDFEARGDLNLLEVPRANSPAIAKGRILIPQAVRVVWIIFVTESTIIATIHCFDVGYYCLLGNPLVAHISYHAPCTFLIVIVSYWVVLFLVR